MNIVKRKKKLITKLRDKEYRDAFLSELIANGIPFQVKALREQRKWTQKELGDMAEMAQESISRLEDPNYGKLNLTTLKRLASSLDVGLMIRFVPFSELVEWELNLSAESLEVLSFDQESYFQPTIQETNTTDLHQYVEIPEQSASDNVIYIDDYLLNAQFSTNQKSPAPVASCG